MTRSTLFSASFYEPTHPHNTLLPALGNWPRHINYGVGALAQANRIDSGKTARRDRLISAMTMPFFSSIPNAMAQFELLTPQKSSPHVWAEISLKANSIADHGLSELAKVTQQTLIEAGKRRQLAPEKTNAMQVVFVGNDDMDHLADQLYKAHSADSSSRPKQLMAFRTSERIIAVNAEKAFGPDGKSVTRRAYKQLSAALSNNYLRDQDFSKPENFYQQEGSYFLPHGRKTLRG